MQIIFDPKCSVAKYAEQGKEFDFPGLGRCQNGRCRSQTVHKHGFYERNCLTDCLAQTLHQTLLLPSMRQTVSFLPSFVAMVSVQLVACMLLVARLKAICAYGEPASSQSQYPKLSWSPSQISAIASGFDNLPRIELVLREGSI